MNREEMEKRRMEDMALTTLNFRNESGSAEKISIPLQYRLDQNYPNPFNPTTIIKFEIPVSSYVTLKVYDITGKEVKTLVNEFKQNGNYQVTFNGINLSSGIYYFCISAGNWSQVRKMILIK